MLSGGLDDISVSKKGLMLLLFPFVIQVGLLFAFSDQVRRTEENQDLAIHSQDVLLSISRVSQDALEANAAVRSFLLFSDSKLSEVYQVKKESARAEIKNLFSLIQDNEVAASFAKHLNITSEELFKSLDETLALLQSENTKAAFEQAANLEVRRLRFAVMDAVDKFSNYEKTLSTRRKQELEARRDTMALIVSIGFILCALATVTANSIFSKNVSERLKDLAKKVEGFKKGVEPGPPTEAADEIGEVDRAFTSLTRTLDSRNREIELFIYSVSHDLRSPLINLEGFSAELSNTADKLKKLFHGDDPTTVNANKAEILKVLDDNLPRALKFIRSAVERLSGIINSLLYLSRVGRVPFSWTKVSLEPLLERVVNALEGSISEKKVELIVETLPNVAGDSTALEQIFGNLLSNAVQYTDPIREGKIKVFDATSQRNPPSGYVTIGVSDNGLGIPDTAVEKLFIGFQRFHPEQGKGEGIGLAAVRRLVERHGGNISVESKVGIGTVFYIDLPIAIQERVNFDESCANIGTLSNKT